LATNDHPDDAQSAPAIIPKIWRTPMRKMMALSLAVMIALFAIGTWATATTTSHEPVGDSGYRINVFEMMLNSGELQVQHFEAF
jgi:hypothetical protein